MKVCNKKRGTNNLLGALFNFKQSKGDKNYVAVQDEWSRANAHVMCLVCHKDYPGEKSDAFHVYTTMIFYPQEDLIGVSWFVRSHEKFDHPNYNILRKFLTGTGLSGKMLVFLRFPSCSSMY